MKYKASTEGVEIVKKDYSKKIIFSLDDFDKKGHLLQVVTIPPDTRQRLHSHQVQTEVFCCNHTIISRYAGKADRPCLSSEEIAEFL